MPLTPQVPWQSLCPKWGWVTWACPTVSSPHNNPQRHLQEQAKVLCAREHILVSRDSVINSDAFQSSKLQINKSDLHYVLHLALCLSGCQPSSPTKSLVSCPCVPAAAVCYFCVLPTDSLCVPPPCYLCRLLRVLTWSHAPVYVVLIWVLRGLFTCII